MGSYNKYLLTEKKNMAYSNFFSQLVLSSNRNLKKYKTDQRKRELFITTFDDGGIFDNARA